MKRFIFLFTFYALLLILNACSSDSSAPPADVYARAWSGKIDGDSVRVYRLVNSSGMQVDISNFGGRILSLRVPDHNGELSDVVLGYDSLFSYQKKGEPYFGAIIGRYANRIAKGTFSLGGKSYSLESNDGTNTLHGGYNGFSSRVFTAKQLDKSRLMLSLFSTDGEGGYPGNLSVKVIYSLLADNRLQIDYEAKSDKETIVNLTNHAYFNLNGEGQDDILNHELEIAADYFTPVDSVLIPFGNLSPVAGSAFDFRKPKLIGKDIDLTEQQLIWGKGYDHNFVLNPHAYNLPVASVWSRKTGIKMEVFTSEPGLQFYSGNFLDGKDFDGKMGSAYPHRSGFCLETQHFPDSPNHANFPSVVLKPGQVYKSVSAYKFSILK